LKKLLLAVLAVTLSTLTLSSPTHFTANAQENHDSKDKVPDKAPDQSQDQKLEGKWHFVFDTQGGDREFEADFTVDKDGNVTGTWDKAPVAGTYKDDHMQLAFEVTSQEAGETAQLQLDGKIGDDSNLTGTWGFSSYNGNFKATRPQP
jgi:hypothetical protein